MEGKMEGKELQSEEKEVESWLGQLTAEEALCLRLIPQGPPVVVKSPQAVPASGYEQYSETITLHPDDIREGTFLSIGGGRIGGINKVKGSAGLDEIVAYVPGGRLVSVDRRARCYDFIPLQFYRRAKQPT